MFSILKQLNIYNFFSLSFKFNLYTFGRCFELRFQHWLLIIWRIFYILHFLEFSLASFVQSNFSKYLCMSGFTVVDGLVTSIYIVQCFLHGEEFCIANNSNFSDVTTLTVHNILCIRYDYWIKYLPIPSIVVAFLFIIWNKLYNTIHILYKTNR